MNYKKSQQDQTVNLRLNRKLKHALLHLTEQESRTISEIMRQALTDILFRNGIDLNYSSPDENELRHLICLDEADGPGDIIF